MIMVQGKNIIKSFLIQKIIGQRGRLHETIIGDTCSAVRRIKGCSNIFVKSYQAKSITLKN